MLIQALRGERFWISRYIHLHNVLETTFSQDMKKNLLVIERNTRDSLANLLTAEGHSICLAETAGAGLEALKRHKITHAVVLNALSMRTNGDRTCAALRKAAPNTFLY